MISRAIEPISAEKFWSFAKSEPVKAALTAKLLNPEIEGFIVFENMQMDSSSFGDQTFIQFGPASVYKHPFDAEGKWLNDLPSQRQYAHYYISTEELKK